MVKKSVVRKETDVDFEEKKMNMSLAQDEIDKENDYYVIRKPENRSVVVHDR
jgi:nuclear protein NHN1